MAGAQGDNDIARNVGQRLAKLEDSRFDCKHAIEELGKLLAVLSEDAQIEAQLIRTEMQNFGLGEARVHFRVNAVQVANALHADIGLESAGGGGDNRRRLARIDTLLGEVHPERVNLGSVIAEPTTARRMMMLASLIHRQIDPHIPIRFLIAECNSPYIVLSALYLARLFGVDQCIDISPLFETRGALERGPDLIERLLNDKHFRAYTKSRGRLAIQTGFSDGGRAIGQASVSLAIERLRIKVAELLARARLPRIDLLVFDTHGKSVGRGGHPGELSDRFNYIDTPFSRGVMHDLGLTHLQESSFQGGDGYLLFGNPAIASATVGAVIDHWLAPPPPARDPFYANQDYSLEFFLDMSAFNEALANDRNYVYWLSSWAQSVLPPSGSRAVSRPNEERKSIFDMRAIPHNAMLQQMGMLVNSLAGTGAALGNDPDRAAEMYQSSARFRSLLALVARARAVSSIDAMGAYTDLLNPVKWLRRAALADGEDRSRRMRRVAKGLSDYGSYRQANAFMHRIVDDILDLDRVFERCGTPCTLSAADIALDLMHAVRVTLARRILLLAAEIPSFTPRNDVDPKRLDRDLNMFDVPKTVATLRIVFPESPPLVVDDSFGGPATYKSDFQHGYRDLHEQVFAPLETCHAILRDIGAAIAHEIGAFG